MRGFRRALVASLLVVGLAAGWPAAGAPAPASEMADRIADATALPPWPGPLDVRGVEDQPYAQLEADLWTLNRHLAAGGTWATLARSVRVRLWRVYPEYLAAATRQRVMAAGEAAGIATLAQAWGYWTRRWGDPLLQSRGLMQWFLVTLEAAP